MVAAAAAAELGVASEVVAIVFVVAFVLAGTAVSGVVVVPLCLRTCPLQTTFCFVVLVLETAFVNFASAFATAFENSLQPAPFDVADSCQKGLELHPCAHPQVRWGRLGF